MLYWEESAESALYCFRENCTMTKAAEPLLSMTIEIYDKKPCLAILSQPNLQVRNCKINNYSIFMYIALVHA